MGKVPGDRILIEPKPLEKKTESGILISYGEDEKRHEAATNEGYVVAIGEHAFKDLWDGSVPIKLGDYVLFAKFSGVFVKDPETDKVYVICNDEDILYIIKSGEEK